MKALIFITKNERKKKKKTILVQDKVKDNSKQNLR